MVLFLIALVSAIGYLAYQAYASNLPNELIIPIAVVVILLLTLIIWYLPKFYVQSLPNEAGKTFDRENAKLKLEDDTRKTFAQIVGGAVLLGGLVFTFNTFRLQQEGQFTDRFTKAVTQIGDDKLEVRLGGLYALERIAKDSPKDHWTVIEILSAYVREKAKKKETGVKNTESNSNTNANNKTDEPKEYPKIATDVQTALTIIGRRKTEQDTKYRVTDGLNLSDTYLRDARLVRAKFSYATLIATDLSKAIIVLSDFSWAILDRANLSETSFNNVDFNKTSLFSTNLSGADLKSVENLTFEQLSKAIIDKNTSLPEDLENQKAELLELSKKNLAKEKKN